MSWRRIVRRTRRAIRRETRPVRHAARRALPAARRWAARARVIARRRWPDMRRAVRGYAAGELSWKGTAIGIAISTLSITTLLVLFGAG